MRGDFSRIRFSPNKNYTAVLEQQGRVALDADTNEQAAINNHLREAETVDVIGPYGGPDRQRRIRYHRDESRYLHWLWPILCPRSGLRERCHTRLRRVSLSSSTRRPRNPTCSISSAAARPAPSRSTSKSGSVSSPRLTTPASANPPSARPTPQLGGKLSGASSPKPFPRPSSSTPLRKASSTAPVSSAASTDSSKSTKARPVLKGVSQTVLHLKPLTKLLSFSGSNTPGLLHHHVRPVISTGKRNALRTNRRWLQ